jgi:CubicO group peptidase (beta-lactamase class C family)
MAMDELADRIVSPEGGDSLVIVHGGRLVFERYADGLGPDTLLPSFSMSKSFATTLAGMLVDDGTLGLDQRAPIAAWADPGDPRHAITVRHLLTMTSGLEWDESYTGDDADPFQLQLAGDHAGFVTSRPLEFEPGSRFRYSTGDTAVLSRVIAEAAGVSGPSYEALIHERLLDPLGIDPVLLGFDEVGVWRGGSTTITTTRNYAKLGLLYLRNGRWEGRQLLSPGFGAFARSPGPSANYGAGFWLNGNGRFQMLGILGQGVEVAPALDLVVAVNNDPNRNAHLAEVVALFETAADPVCGPDEPVVTTTPTPSPTGAGQLPATGAASTSASATAAMVALAAGVALVAVAGGAPRRRVRDAH